MKNEMLKKTSLFGLGATLLVLMSVHLPGFPRNEPEEAVAAPHRAVTTTTAASEDIKTPMTAERAHRRWQPDELTLSPDRRRLAFSVTTPGEGPEPSKNIWLLDLATEEMRQYSFPTSKESHPLWSPSGTHLAFLSNRSGKSQVYLLALDGGEARAVTSSETSVQSFAFSPDGRQIAFVAPEPKTEEERQEEREIMRYAGMQFYSTDKPLQLWVVTLESGETRQLTHSPWRIAESYWEPNLVWDPQGDQLYISATDDPQPELLTYGIYRLRLADGKLEEFARPHGGFGHFQISPDGKMLSYLGARGEAFEPDDLFVVPLSGGTPRNLTGDSIDRRLWGYEWLPDGDVVVQALWGFHSRFFRCSLSGEARPYQDFDVPASGHYSYSKAFAATPEKLVFVGERAEVAPEIWIFTGSGKARKLSNFNREWEDIPTSPMEIVRYPSFDGLEIEAGLLKPAGYRQGTRIPFVILIHGGPSAKFSDDFRAWSQMLTSEGIGVLCPNIRGSTGYGYEFLVSNRYDWGGADFKDVMASADYIVDLGIADPSRIGIGGWSYGGYMSAWTVTQTDRFKAAVIGAPMIDMVSMYGTSERWSQAYDTWYLGTPYQNPELFRRISPLTYVQNVKTPTLLMVGENDPNTPLSQSLQFYRGLQRFGVESKLAIYTRSGHFPGAARQQIDVHRRFVGWLTKHLKKD